MAIRGYFEPVRGPLLTGVSLRDGLAGNGITVSGEVLEGRIGMDEEALVLSWIRRSGEGVLKAVVESKPERGSEERATGPSTELGRI